MGHRRRLFWPSGSILFFILQPGDAARIKKQFAFLSANIDKAPGENQLIGAANAKRIRAAFTETVTIHAPAYNYTRDLARPNCRPWCSVPVRPIRNCR